MIYYNCTYIFFLQYHTIIRANLYVCPLQLLNPIFNVFTLNHLECNSFNGEKTCRTIHVFHFAFCWGGGVLLLHRTSTIPASVNMPDMLSDVWRWRGRSQVSQAYVFISVKLSPGKSKLTQVLILFDLFFWFLLAILSRDPFQTWTPWRWCPSSSVMRAGTEGSDAVGCCVTLRHRCSMWRRAEWGDGVH